MELYQRFENYMYLKNYADKTISSYGIVLKNLLKDDADFFERTEDEMIAFLSARIRAKKSSVAYVALHVSVANIVLKHIVKRDVFIRLPRPRKPIMQPDILSQSEMQKMLDMAENIKHKTIMALMYSAGFRVNEVCSLRKTDIDEANNYITIRNAKGMKDRRVILDSGVLAMIKSYLQQYKPQYYLFNGQKGDKYSTRSVQQIVIRTAKKAGIDKKISSHSLRHSCFTQLVKEGVDIRFIQKLAGHAHITSTARYLQIQDEDVLNIKSPIKGLKL